MLLFGVPSIITNITGYKVHLTLAVRGAQRKSLTNMRYLPKPKERYIFITRTDSKYQNIKICQFF